MAKRHELVIYPDGTRSLRETAGGQAMHSWIGPWAEANLLYVEQSGFESLCREPGSECVLFDVGLGLAANALAAIERFRGAACRGRLRIVSFENDLDGLASALEHREDFDFLGRHSTALERLLSQHSWREQTIEGGTIEWQLLEGDFRKRLAHAPMPDVIFWDFYDPKTCPELWSVEVFRQLREHCAPNERAIRLFTYSASTPTRLGLALAGFFVGYGRRTPVKAETTAAATRPELLERPLGPEWIAKLRRSAKASPYGEMRALEEILAELRRHPQFAGAGT